MKFIGSVECGAGEQAALISRRKKIQSFWRLGHLLNANTQIATMFTTGTTRMKIHHPEYPAFWMIFTYGGTKTKRMINNGTSWTKTFGSIIQTPMILLLLDALHSASKVKSEAKGIGFYDLARA